MGDRVAGVVLALNGEECCMVAQYESIHVAHEHAQRIREALSWDWRQS
jgi:hypothetical protein